MKEKMKIIITAVLSFIIGFAVGVSVVPYLTQSIGQQPTIVISFLSDEVSDPNNIPLNTWIGLQGDFSPPIEGILLTVEISKDSETWTTHTYVSLRTDASGHFENSHIFYFDSESEKGTYYIRVVFKGSQTLKPAVSNTITITVV